jgi:FlaA1/EpsC-like NDP-sugar epimerase
VNPASIMGATKKIGEMLVQCVAQGGAMKAACVRFGNVMGSRGSVIPLFQKQIAGGGPVTVTHPEVVRFFMTIPEAVQLILCAGSLAQRGEVYVLDMGSPRKILELAREMIRLSGLEPGRDIQIAITGLRPGEKLNEELTGPTEIPCKTRFEKLSKVGFQPVDEPHLSANAAGLVKAAERNDGHAIRAILANMRIGFRSSLASAREPGELADIGSSPGGETREEAVHAVGSAQEAAVAIQE